jgi:hypothetical protein
MLDPNSEIADFYPEEFAEDLNGKKQDWEALVLIPFINEERLLAAMASKAHLLTDAMLARNIHTNSIRLEYEKKSAAERKRVFALGSVTERHLCTDTGKMPTCDMLDPETCLILKHAESLPSPLPFFHACACFHFSNSPVCRFASGSASFWCDLC